MLPIPTCMHVPIQPKHIYLFNLRCGIVHANLVLNQQYLLQKEFALKYIYLYDLKHTYSIKATEVCSYMSSAAMPCKHDVCVCACEVICEV